ncbi:MAG: phosphate acyltransferase PlsX [Bacteroidales bacterium]|nr:phosphate acyltransferase PlsX [Bacteroidales bacterium]
MIRIGIDAMGGDFAPNNVILGAIEAYSQIGADSRIYLIGDEKKITEVCQHYGIDSGNFVIEHAAETIEMGEHPVKAFLKKKQSSLVRGFNLLAEGKIDVLASAGNTGAMLAGSVQVLNNIPGIIRPCIPAQIPLADGRNMLLLDVGFNADPRADVLYQFAIMGSIYARAMMDIENPRVALLNIGAEAEKGNVITQEAYRIMSDSTDFNFVGNMEANMLFSGGIADVLVTDGFVGNVCLKQAEGMYELVAKLGVKHPFFNRFNYETYGGTPVLGVTAPVIIGHGVSTPLAIKNMILQGEMVVRHGLIEKFKEAMLANV